MFTFLISLLIGSGTLPNEPRAPRVHVEYIGRRRLVRSVSSPIIKKYLERTRNSRKILDN